jgi:hypothetical protein
MSDEQAFQCGACETAHDTAKDAMACCRGAERGVSRLTNWPDAIYDATGWVVSDGLAYAIGGMVEAARRDAAGEAGRLRNERDRLREALRLADGAVNAAYAQAHAEHAGHSTTEAKCDAAIAAFRTAARAALGEDRA